ncbi:uncharacterized protein LOC110835608 isoform X2 [Zootermopsis nevadensis]|uniref:uncharacterized protein LOC110835608 isoform X2 n=1 Tax=Zootermopsis nevadensis TaxID=136037 RepID=UPI000B8E9A2B|nr:uncharacterized protein LOC110835608 isoform X2 [Zootermopsis nevadensis]
MFKRRFGTPQSNRIDKYFIKEMEHLDVSNSTFFSVNENACEFDGRIPPCPIINDCVEMCEDHSSSCPQENVTKSETFLEKSEEDIVMIYENIGNSGRNSGSSDAADTTVAGEKHSYDSCKQDVNIIDDERGENGTSIDSEQTIFSTDGFRGFEEADASSINNIFLNESSYHVEGEELKSEGTLQSYIIYGKNHVITDLSSLSDDEEGIIIKSDGSDIESCNEKRLCVRSQKVYFDSGNSQDFEFVENTGSAVIDVSQNHTNNPHWFKTNVFDKKSSAEEHMYFTLTRVAVLDRPNEQSASASNGDEPKINCPANDVVFVSSPASEPETIKRSSKQEDLRSCDYSKSLVVNNCNGNSECINIKAVTDCIPKRDSGVVYSAKNSNITFSSDKRLLNSSISDMELVVDNTLSSNSENREDADGLVASDRDLMVIDLPVAELVGFNECGSKSVTVDDPERELGKELLITSKCDRTLMLPGYNEEESLHERTVTASCRSRKVNPDLFIMSYEAVMYKHHDSVGTRMGLECVPACCLDPYSCAQCHKSAMYKRFEVCDARCQTIEDLMNTKQWPSVFEYCYSNISERYFPSASAALRILDFILNTHDDNLLGSAVSVFKKIVDLHPPCAPDMLKYYRTVLTNTLGEDTPHISRNGIVLDAIYNLKDLQNEDLGFNSSDVHEDTLVTHSTPNNIVDDGLHCEEYPEGSAYERAEADKNFNTLKDNEKLNRLFRVLEIIVKLFEVDISVFLVKQSFQLQKALRNQLYRPLIVSVLWGTSTVHEIGHLNANCRYIIDLYANCFFHKICYNQRNIVARLLNLVAEAVRASECNNELMYPYFGQCCKTLAQEVSSYISGMNPEDMAEALTHMMPSFLTLYVTNYLLSSAVGYETIPSLETIVELIQKPFLSSEEKAEKMHPEMSATSNCKLLETKRNINKRDMRGYCRTDMRSQSKDGTTPLIDAAESNQLESCKLLLKYGGSSLLKDKNNRGMNALDAATAPDIKALLESFGTEDNEIIKGEAVYSPLPSVVPVLLPIMFRAYMDTYQTLHIVETLNSFMHDSDTKTIHTKRKGRPKFKFDSARFLKDYRSFKKLKGIIRSEGEKSHDNEIIRKFLLLI